MASSFIETQTDASRILFIDSRDGKNLDGNPQITTHYEINLQDPVVVPPHHAILLSLHRMNVPRTFYNFAKNRNAGVEIRFESAGGGTGAGFGSNYVGNIPTLTFEINEGNYNAISLMNKLTTIVNNYLDNGTSRFSSTNLIVADQNVYEFKMLFNQDTLKYEWAIQPKTEANKQTRDIRMTWLWKTGASFGSDLTTKAKDTSIRQEVGFITNRWINGTTFDYWMDFVPNAGGTDLVPTAWKWNYGFGSASTDGGAWGNTDPIDTSTGGIIRSITGLLSQEVADNLYYFRGYDDGANNRETGDNNYFSCVDMNYHTSDLYLHTSITNHSVIDSRLGCRYSNILSRVPVDVANGNQVVVEPSDGAVHKLMLKVRDITQIEIRLSDLDDIPIDLNGLDWTMSLEFDFITLPQLEVPKDKRLSVEEERYKAWMETKEGKEKLKELKKIKEKEGQILLPNV